MDEESSTLLGHNINESHPLIGELKVEDIIFTGLQSQSFQTLQNATEILPPEHRPKLSKDRVPHYQAALVSFEKNNDANGYGIIYITGATGTGPAYGHVAAELFRKGEATDKSLNLSAVIGSSASIDTIEQTFSADITERAAYQAAFIVELLKKYPTKSLYLLGQSLGGMEVNYVVPILKGLLEKENIETEVSGLILFQSGGVFEQKLANVAKSIPEFMSLRAGIEEIWPSPDQETKAREQMDLAREHEDMAESLRWKTRLASIEAKRQNPEHLTEDELEKLRRIDSQLESFPSQKDRNKLFKQRYQLLYPVVQRVSNTDSRPRVLSKELGALLNTVRATISNKGRKFDVTRALPEWIRERIKDFPVAIVWGREDEFFPADLAKSKMDLKKIRDVKRLREETQIQDMDTLYQLGSYFPNAPIVYQAEILAGPHELANTDIKTFGNIVTNLVERMKTWNKSYSEKTRSKQQEVVELHFS